MEINKNKRRKDEWSEVKDKEERRKGRGKDPYDKKKVRKEIKEENGKLAK